MAGNWSKGTVPVIEWIPACKNAVYSRKKGINYTLILFACQIYFIRRHHKDDLIGTIGYPDDGDIIQ